MNLGHILFSPHGRIGQNEYWLGMLIVVLANLFLTPVPFIGGLVFLGLLYVGAVVPAKRLHDAGKTGWIHLIPWAISLSLLGFGVVAAGGAAIAPFLDVVGKPGGWEALESGDLSPQATAQLVSGGVIAAGGLLLFWSLSALTWLVYTIWVGVLSADPDDNAYGPAPKSARYTQAATRSAGAPPAEG
ncbi:DUF805 domain-containing protein [Oceanicaulis sp. MMSF_3324]|uniref:DUF805 domain-containing protein n=1 Tax=Oceanicaulis sp. MMSF_3324 TaxID=3046702 RepID=UPI00273ECD10|nr:DUF805 domain-containing protein [Oceanicaulis sp. MMSF_3324]